MLGAVLRDAARSNRERADTQITGAGTHERSTVARRQPGRDGRENNAVGDAHADSEQLSEICCLAANLRHGGHAHIAEAPNHRGRHRLIPFEVAAAIAARTTQSMSSAASSTDAPRWSRHMRNADEAVRTTSKRVMRSRWTLGSFGRIESATRWIRSTRLRIVACRTSSAIGLAYAASARSSSASSRSKYARIPPRRSSRDVGSGTASRPVRRAAYGYRADRRAPFVPKRR